MVWACTAHSVALGLRVLSYGLALHGSGGFKVCACTTHTVAVAFRVLALFWGKVSGFRLWGVKLWACVLSSGALLTVEEKLTNLRGCYEFPFYGQKAGSGSDLASAPLKGHSNIGNMLSYVQVRFMNARVVKRFVVPAGALQVGLQLPKLVAEAPHRVCVPATGHRTSKINVLVSIPKPYSTQAKVFTTNFLHTRNCPDWNMYGVIACWHFGQAPHLKERRGTFDGGASEDSSPSSCAEDGQDAAAKRLRAPAPSCAEEGEDAAAKRLRAPDSRTSAVHVEDAGESFIRV